MYWQYGEDLAYRLDWSIVSLGIIFPVTQAIGMAFKRRDDVRCASDTGAGRASLFGALIAFAPVPL